MGLWFVNWERKNYESMNIHSKSDGASEPSGNEPEIDYSLFIGLPYWKNENERKKLREIERPSNFFCDLFSLLSELRGKKRKMLLAGRWFDRKRIKISKTVNYKKKWDFNLNESQKKLFIIQIIELSIEICQKKSFFFEKWMIDLEHGISYVVCSSTEITSSWSSKTSIFNWFIFKKKIELASIFWEYHKQWLI